MSQNIFDITLNISVRKSYIYLYIHAIETQTEYNFGYETNSKHNHSFDIWYLAWMQIHAARLYWPTVIEYIYIVTEVAEEIINIIMIIIIVIINTQEHWAEQLSKSPPSYSCITVIMQSSFRLACQRNHRPLARCWNVQRTTQNAALKRWQMVEATGGI